MNRLSPLFALPILFATATFAQTTFGSITGTVTDASGLPVPGAEILGKETSSGYVYQAKTNESGIFTLPNLREGSYQVSVTASGFQESRASEIKLASREIRRLDFKLQIGSVSTEIEVKGSGARLVETETARISQDRTAEELRDLPLATRSITAFLSLVRFAQTGSKSGQSNATWHALLRAASRLVSTLGI